MTKRRTAKALSEWGKRGNAARNAKLSPERRSEIARKAGLANAQRIARLRAELDGYRANSAKQGGDGQ